MKKVDIIISPIIGFLIGVFFFVSLKALEGKIPFPPLFTYSWILLIVFPPLTLFGLFIASIIGKKFLFIYQMAKFVLVGALNTMIDLGVLNILMRTFEVYAGPAYSLFKGISFLTATTNSYFWNKHWTFGKREETFAPIEYSKFVIITTIGLLINVSVASFVVNVIGPQFGIGKEMWANIGAFSAVLVAWIWNFSGAKFIVFKK